MSDPSDDMDKPITRREAYDIFLTKREFHEVMKNLFEYLDKKFDALEQRFISFGAEIRAEIDTSIHASESRLKTWFSGELAQHTNAVDERHRTELSVIDDKYTDLPDRVTKLEVAVFPAPPTKRQRRR